MTPKSPVCSKDAITSLLLQVLMWPKEKENYLDNNRQSSFYSYICVVYDNNINTRQGLNANLI